MGSDPSRSSLLVLLERETLLSVFLLLFTDTETSTNISGLFHHKHLPFITSILLCFLHHIPVLRVSLGPPAMDANHWEGSQLPSISWPICGAQSADLTGCLPCWWLFGSRSTIFHALQGACKAPQPLLWTPDSSKEPLGVNLHLRSGTLPSGWAPDGSLVLQKGPELWHFLVHHEWSCYSADLLASCFSLLLARMKKVWKVVNNHHL